MSDYRDLLEQERQRHMMPDGSVDGLRRRRDRKRRNGQILAGVVALLIAAAGIGGGLFALRGSSAPRPGGQTPTPTPTPPPGGGETGPSQVSGPIQFIDDKRGWMVDGDGQILATADGGSTWSVQLSGPSSVKAIDILDGQYGWGVFDGGLVRTTDGGAHWVTWSNQALSSIQFIDPLRGWGIRADPADPNNGVVVSTSDGGHTWGELPADAPVQSLCFAKDSRVLWAAGGAPSGFWLFRSDDLGATWGSSFSEVLPPEGWTASIRCGGIDAWLLVTAGGAAGHIPYALFKTAEGGPNAIPVLQEAGTHPLGLGQGAHEAEDPYPGPFWAFNGVDALFVGWCPPCGNSVSVYGSATGWQRSELVKESATPLGISFVDLEHGWLLLRLDGPKGPEFGVLATSDGGVTWTNLG